MSEQMMPAAFSPPRLTKVQFAAIRELVFRVSGINLHEGKEGLVQSRLARRLRALGLPDFDGYLEHVRADGTGKALSDLVDALTTNKTSFFRESRHFDLLREQIVPALVARQRRIRLWSAGCSSGEEPYTLAMVLRHAMPSMGALDVRILATDLATPVLDQARQGVYAETALRDVPERYARTCFRCVRREPPRAHRVTEDVRALVQFARLNLIDPWPMRGPMDVIFCRNVMIYFRKETQERLIERFTDLLAPGGTLFVGHSESLSGIAHSLRYVQPSVYVK
ncbi:MAG: CheR family methyltransferase [Longimicrobiales bacterium]